NNTVLDEDETIICQKVDDDLFNISDDYAILKCLGHGAFGHVAEAYHRKTNTSVAIKKVEIDKDQNISEEYKFLQWKRLSGEIFILNALKGKHEGVVQLYDVRVEPNNNRMKEVYLTMNLMATDLDKLIKSRRLTKRDIQRYTYKIIKAIQYIHSANVALKNSLNKRNMSNYGVGTEIYRAPELLLRCSHYNRAVDLWSIGCIFGEMFEGTSLFTGARFYQLYPEIFELIGTPTTNEDIEWLSEECRCTIRSSPVQPESWEKLSNISKDPDALGLLQKLLVFNQNDRINAQKASKDPYFALDSFDQSVENEISEIKISEDSKTVQDVQQKIYNQVKEIRLNHKKMTDDELISTFGFQNCLSF
ncbi:unnamed protein product, partial [Didymodactylos carnosus]